MNKERRNNQELDTNEKEDFRKKYGILFYKRDRKGKNVVCESGIGRSNLLSGNCL